VRGYCVRLPVEGVGASLTDHRQSPRLSHRAQPGGAQLHGAGAGPIVAGRHHLHLDGAALTVRPRHAGPVHAPGGELGHGLRVGRVPTDRGTKFCGSHDRHGYELYLAVEDIDHTRTKARSPQMNGICERFHKTLLDEFYRVAFRKKLYATAAPARCGASTCPRPGSMPCASLSPSAPIGGSRTACIGCSVSASTRTAPETDATMAPKTSPPCVNSPSTCCDPRGPTSSSDASANDPDGPTHSPEPFSAKSDSHGYIPPAH